MVNEQGIIKLIDFGVSKIAFNQKSHIVGSHFFIAPEIVHQKYLLINLVLFVSLLICGHLGLLFMN